MLVSSGLVRRTTPERRTPRDPGSRPNRVGGAVARALPCALLVLSAVLSAGTLPFTLPRSARVRLEVFDVAGRLVRLVLDGQLPPGRHAATWDELDGGGARVAHGVYFYRFRSALCANIQ